MFCFFYISLDGFSFWIFFDQVFFNPPINLTAFYLKEIYNPENDISIDAPDPERKAPPRR